jgi:hypothetical protein
LIEYGLKTILVGVFCTSIETLEHYPHLGIIMKNFVSLAIVGVSLLLNALNVLKAQAPDVVVMIDLTGSTSAADVDKEREATRSLLRQFSQIVPKPRVSIGSFNVVNERAENADNAARIQAGGELTDSYGNEQSVTGLFEVLNKLPRPDGYTDIGAAISVAQAHLDATGGSGRDFIVLITDGTSNRPGTASYSGCNACGCDNALAATRISATESKAKGTTIFGVHYQGNAFNTTCPNEPQAGLNFLKSDIVTSENTFFESFGDLPSMFASISCAVRCDDGNSCTADSCNTTSGQCEFAPSTTDSDKDGIVDCSDTCKGNDLLLGQSCNNSQESCQGSGYYGCSAGGEVSCVSNATSVEACKGCTETDISGVLKNIVAAQDKAKSVTVNTVNRYKKALKKSRGKFSKKDKSTEESVQKLYKAGQGIVRSLPGNFQQCSNATLCTTIFSNAKLNQVMQEANFYQKTTVAFQKKLRKLSGVTAKTDRKSIADLKLTVKQIKEAVSLLPASYSECR